MVKRRDKVSRIRHAILGAVGVLVTLVVGYGLYHALGLGGFGNAEPYVELDKPDGTGVVEVVTYFSFACPNCRSLERLMDDFERRLPEGVALRRVHVAYSESARLHAKAHRALERHGAAEKNSDRLFHAIHDRNRVFNTPGELADFVDGHGVDQDTFLRTMGSGRIGREVAAAERRFVALGLTSVPALVVDDKYIISMDAGRKQALDVTEELVRDLLAKRAGG